MQSQNQSLVSIALCTYNGERFLTQQLDSLLSQDYSNIEIIIVDDYSGDGTWAILESYEKSNPRIKLYRNQQNTGYTKSFEKAINLCNGEYISLCDQDDIWEKNKISILVEEIKGNILVYHNSDYIDINEQSINNETVATMFRMYDGPSCLPFILSNCIHGHAALFSNKLKKYIFPFDKRFPHDWWLAYAAFNVGSVKYIDKVLVHYRQHQHSITDTFKLQETNASGARPVRGIERISLNLELLKYCADYKFNREPVLMKKAHYLFSNLAKEKERIRSFFFLLKYFDLLFYLRYKPKSFLSKVNMVRKICFS